MALLIQNTAGQEGAEEDPRLVECYKKADIAIACFSVKESQTFDNLVRKWIPEVSKARPGIPIMFAAQMADEDVEKKVEKEAKQEEEEETIVSVDQIAAEVGGEESSEKQAISKEAKDEQSSVVGGGGGGFVIEICEQQAKEMANFIGFATFRKEDKNSIENVYAQCIRGYNAFESRTTAAKNVSNFEIEDSTVVKMDDPQQQQQQQQHKKKCCTIL